MMGIKIFILIMIDGPGIFDRSDYLTFEVDETSFNTDEYFNLGSFNLQVELEFKNGEKTNLNRLFNFNNTPKFVSNNYIRGIPRST